MLTTTARPTVLPMDVMEMQCGEPLAAPSPGVLDATVMGLDELGAVMTVGVMPPIVGITAVGLKVGRGGDDGKGPDPPLPPEPPPDPTPEQVSSAVQDVPAGQHPPYWSLQQKLPTSQQPELPLQHVAPGSQHNCPPQV